MTLTEFKKHLHTQTREELINDLIELYKKNKFVAEFYHCKFSDDDQTEMLEMYKVIVKKPFFPSRGHGNAKLAEAKKAITEFSKLSNNPEQIADLMLFYVENGVAFTLCYGDIDERFYISMEGMYKKALQYLSKHNLSSVFRDRCYKICTDTRNIGWGFHDQLVELFEAHYLAS